MNPPTGKSRIARDDLIGFRVGRAVLCAPPTDGVRYSRLAARRGPRIGLSSWILPILLAGGVLLSLVTASVCWGASPAPPTSWTADNGNGTYSNPLFYEEFEDPDVLRVGEDYYLAGTTMHMNPALIVLHSKDLVNWELASYCMERLDLGPTFRLEGGTVYGRGIWAPCIRHHNGTFYVFSNVNGVGCQLFRSKSPNGPWTRTQLPGMHDLSVLFDDDGKIYAIYGAGRPTIVELNQELTGIVPDSRRQMNAQGMHMAHEIDYDHIKSLLPEHIEPAYDGLKISFSWSDTE